jgi:hypothetical protein
MPLGTIIYVYLNAVRPVSSCLVNLAQRVDCVLGVSGSAGHENSILLQALAERVHFCVDKQGRHMLHRDTAVLVLVAQGGRKTLDKTLGKIQNYS